MMATKEKKQSWQLVVHNVQYFFQKSISKAEALSFIHHEAPSWPPKSMGLG